MRKQPRASFYVRLDESTHRTLRQLSEREAKPMSRIAAALVQQAKKENGSASHA